MVFAVCGNKLTPRYKMTSVTQIKLIPESGNLKHPGKKKPIGNSDSLAVFMLTAYRRAINNQSRLPKYCQ